MKKLVNFLCRTFAATMLFTCFVGFSHTFAEETTKQNLTGLMAEIDGDDAKMHSFCAYKGTNTNTQYNKITLCKIGTYLAGCGDADTGVYWLQGMTKSVSGSNNLIRTPNYYSYDASADITNMENLRHFFAGNKNFEFYREGATVADSADTSEYIPYRNQILSNFCTNEYGKISTSQIRCEKCPNNAIVAASTVEQDFSGQTLCDSWDVHTIADCYMTEFTDDTGTYVYVNEATSDTSGSSCYYSTTVYGSNLYYNQ